MPDLSSQRNACKTCRPVSGVIDVALDGARSRTDEVFLQYYKQVYEMIRDEVAKAIARAD